jgi:hypothetical protein
VLVDGKPVEIKTVLATSYGGEAIRLELSPKEIDCKDLQPASHKENDRLVVVLAKALDKGGAWHVTYVRLQHTSVSLPLAATVTSANADREVRATLDIHHDLSVAGHVVSPAKLDITGTIHAKGCGVLPYDKSVVEQLQPKLTVALNGKPLTIRAAHQFINPPNFDLRLATAPMTCGTIPHHADLHVSIPMGPPQANNPSDPRVSVSGLLLASDTHGPIDKLKLKRLGYDYILDGQVDLFGKTLTLKGSVTPFRCPDLAIDRRLK